MSLNFCHVSKNLFWDPILWHGLDISFWLHIWTTMTVDYGSYFHLYVETLEEDHVAPLLKRIVTFTLISSRLGSRGGGGGLIINSIFHSQRHHSSGLSAWNTAPPCSGAPPLHQTTASLWRFWSAEAAADQNLMIRSCWSWGNWSWTGAETP